MRLSLQRLYNAVTASRETLLPCYSVSLSLITAALSHDTGLSLTVPQLSLIRELPIPSLFEEKKTE